MMYKVIDTIDRYPFVVLRLLNITTGKVRHWCFTVVYEEELCEEYHVKDLKGTILDDVPTHGGWITRQDINQI